ncbi:response regulator transcription factor [Cohnella herbarum]|uniref:Response regulator n=1 Tax=Cohnella herbarum TaxID=2728023 RepID=A0A7Z2ZM56_9BACL|nr:response regulator [Cohnella herbarum]QJD84698.1 response regulator [Cohnella herbarum]
MKILIVDDEVWMRRGIRSMLAGSVLPVEQIVEAEDGIAALELLNRYRPDIVITDIRMPAMDGLSFIEQAASQVGTAQFIVVSGYSDFKYAQDALRLHAWDYILKPIVREQLIDAIRNAYNAKRRQEHTYTQLKRSEKSTRYLQEAWVIEWLLREDSAIPNPEELFGWNPLTRAAVCVSIRIDYPETADQERVRADKELAAFSIRNYLTDWIPAQLLWVAFEYDGALNILLLAPHNPTDLGQLLSRCMDQIESLARRLKFYTIQTGHGISELYWNALTPAVRQSLLALKRKVFVDNGRPMPASKLEWKDKQLEEYIWVGNVEGIRQYIDGGLRSALRERDDVNELEKMTDYLRVLIEKWTIEWVDEQQEEHSLIRMPEPLLYYRDISSLAEGFSRPFVQLSERYRKNRQSDGKKAVESLMDYIRANYGDDLSLTQMANKVHLNANHLSDVFKKATGTTFVSYVLKVRMEKAGEFLKMNGIQIGQIARLVGYEDERYFSTLFKKTYGMTPSEYRRSHLRHD